MGHNEKPRWGLIAPVGTWRSSPIERVGLSQGPSPAGLKPLAQGMTAFALADLGLASSLQKVPRALAPRQPQGKAARGQPSSSQGFHKAAGETTLWAQKQQNCYLTP